MSVKAFFLHPTGQEFRSLRRYTSGQPCIIHGAYHHAEFDLGIFEKDAAGVGISRDDPRWPTTCDCGYLFGPNDEFQLFTEDAYKRSDTGWLTSIRKAPGGALWYADWLLAEGSNMHRGPDGHCLMAKLPNGLTWVIDGDALNCTKPGDHDHKCWVRHGNVPNITVDKDGKTCSAGGGSIQAGDYHGFLRNGEFS